MKVFVTLALMAGLAVAGAARADGPVRPDPQLSPEEVVLTQLRALQDNDGPGRDAGIRQVWEFAHPVNRRMTGPFERFAEMIKGPLYQPLIGHASHAVEAVQQTDNAAVFNADITTPSGAVLRYAWVLERAFGGGLDGSWMTVSVSIATLQGREI